MMFETLVVAILGLGFLAVIRAINDVQHHAKQAAQSLVEIESTLNGITNAISLIESDVNELRAHSVPSSEV